MSLPAENRDPSVDPGVDFYRFANGGWIDAHVIPPGFGAWGSFEELQTRNEAIVHEILEHAASDPQGDLDRMLGDYYASGVDVDAVERGGLGPIAPWLDEVRAVSSFDDLVTLLPRLHRAGLGIVWDWSVQVDQDDSTRHLLWLVQGGLGLPDREAYVADDDAAVALRTAYVEHVAAQLSNAGWDAADALAQAVLDLETRVAVTHLSAVERRDPSRYFNRRDLAALRALAPELDLPGYIQQLGAGAPSTVNVQNPDFFVHLHEHVSVSPVEVVRAWAAFHVVRQTASALPAAFEDAAFDFYGRRIEGKQEPKERWKRVVATLTADMGEALGRRYVETTFSPTAKERALEMVAAILEEMRLSLASRTWMGEDTRAAALTKLAAFGVKIGYPDEWRDWSGLQVDRASYVGNRLAAARFETERQLARLDDAVDRGEWEMPPHVVNAYYHPLRNEIVFPAGILQPPFFDADADDAVNFGGIGTVIAHEVTHGFDDQGSRFDADGAFRDWWEESDRQHFVEVTDRLAAQFDSYETLPGVNVNGRLTLGENIADLGGIALAVRAHAKVSAGAPDVDGLTPAQRFFLSNATVWRGITSDELARTLAQIDPHSPRRYRVLGPVSNLDEFAEAFSLADDAPLMRAPEDRIRIW